MRVAVLIPDPVHAGSRPVREARALAGASKEVTLVAPAQRGVAAPARWPLKPLSLVLSWITTTFALWRLSPDVIHAYGQRVLVRAWLVAKVRRKILVYDALAADRLSRLGRVRERLFLRRCRALVADSTSAARRFEAALGLPALSVLVRDAPEIPANGIRPASIRDRLGIDGARLVLHDARHEETGYEQLVAAIRQVSDVHVVALSEPTHADRLRLVAERNKVAGRVHVLRGVEPSRLASMARATDATVCFPQPEGAGVASAPRRIVQYLAAGRWVLASPPADDGEHQVGVIVVDPSDPHAVATALVDALTAPEVSVDPKSGGWAGEARKLVAFYDRLPSLPVVRRRRHRFRWSVVRVAAREAASLVPRRRSHPTAAVHYAKGRRLRSAGRAREAEAALARAVEIEPENDRYLFHRAAALRGLGRIEHAVEAYRKVVELNGSRPRSIVITSATALARLGVQKEPREVLAALAKIATKTPVQWGRIAELNAALGEVAPALAAVAEIPAETTPELQQVRLRVLEQCGQLTAALEAAKDSGNSAARLRLEGALRALDSRWRPTQPSVDRWEGPRSNATVLHLLETALPHATSGYTYRTSTVLSAQRRAGLSPVAVTRLGFPATRGIHSHPTIDIVDGVVHHCLTIPGVTQYTVIPNDERLEHNVRLLGSLIEELRPAVLHATSPHFNGLLGLSLRDSYGIGLVYEARGFPEMTWAVRPGGTDTEAYGLRREAETRCMREADAVITLSHVMRDHIVERGIDGDRVFVVPHMVDTARFSPQPKDPALERRYGLEGKTVVGYVSSLVDYEGVEVLLRGIAELRKRHPEVVGLIVGDGLAMPTLRAVTTELGLDDVVRFVGRVAQSETIAHYALMDVFVVPRRGLEVCAYVTPLKPFEAMSMGRCMVVSDLPALAESVGYGEHGVLFKPDDPASLAEALDSVVSDVDLREGLGQRSRAFVQERHAGLAGDVVTRPINAARWRSTMGEKRTIKGEEIG
jgi:glycosyltransferase involved in cell wall biosynthesis